MPGVFITVAPTGAESTRLQNPGIPLSPVEIAAQALQSADRGAAMIHIHGRDTGGSSTLDHAVLRDIIDRVSETTDLVIQLSTGGSVFDSFDDRLAVLDLLPESCSLTCGTVNFGNDVFMNPFPFVEQLFLEACDRGIVPEFECFDMGHISSLHRLLDRHGAPAGGVVHCNLVMGVPGGMPGTPSALVAAQHALPAGASWSATGIGRSHLPILLTTVALGGNVRVGMEDTLRYSPTELVSDNSQLVERAARVIAEAQLELLVPGEVRERIGVSSTVT